MTNQFDDIAKNILSGNKLTQKEIEIIRENPEKIQESLDEILGNIQKGMEEILESKKEFVQKAEVHGEEAGKNMEEILEPVSEKASEVVQSAESQVKTILSEESKEPTKEKHTTKSELLAQLQEIQKRQKEKAEQIAILEEENSKLAKKNKVTSPEPKDNSSEKSDQKEEKEIKKLNNTEDASLEDQEELIKPINLEEDENEKLGENKNELEKFKKLENPGIDSEKDSEIEKDAVNIEKENDKVLNEIEETQKAKKESWFSRQKESITNAYKKGEDWWFKEDKKGWEKGLKSAISAGFIGVSILGIANLGEYLPKNLNFQNRVTYRALMAGGIGAFLGSETFKNIIFSAKEKWSEMKPWQRKAVIAGAGITALVGTGALIATTGVATLGAAGVGILGRLGVDKYYKKDKESKETEKKKLEERITDLNQKIAEYKSNKDLDQEKLLKFLEQHEKDQKEVEEKIKEVNKKLKNIEIKKSLLKGGASILAGTVGVLVTETAFNQNIKGNVREFFNKNILSEFKSDNITEKPNTVFANEIPKQEEESFWSKTINKIKSIGKNDHKNENMVKMSKDLDRDMISRSDTKDIPENENVETSESTTNSENNSTEGNQNTEETTNKTTNQNQEQPIKDTSEKIVGDKIDIKTIKPESIIDSQKNVGETYVYRSLIRSDSELAEKLAKYQGLNLDKIDDDRYMANYLKKLAIKLGRMDNEGHEIRYNEKAIGDISLKLDVDKDGKLISYEIDKEGVVKDVHHEGDSFEKDLEDYEESKLQKTYSKINEAYEKNEGLVKPERIVSTEDDPFSNSYLNEDDSREYFENQYSSGKVVKPDEIDDDNIVAPEKVASVYKFENINTSPDWENLKNNNLKDFFATGKINMSEEEIKIAESLRAFYKQALEISNNDEDFQDFVRNNPKLTIGEATNLYKDVIKEENFTEILKEKYHFYDWKDSLSRVEVKSETMKEMEKIAKDNFKGKFSQSELKSINRFYEKNLSLIIKEDRDAWYEYKDQSASDYLKTYKDDHDDFTNFLKDLKKVTGLKPNNGFLGLGHKEQIDEYIMRATMKAKLDGRLDEINLLKKTTIIEEYQNETEDYKEYKPYDPSKNTENSLKPSKAENIKTEVKNETEDYKEYKPYDPSKNIKKEPDDLYREN